MYIYIYTIYIYIYTMYIYIYTIYIYYIYILYIYIYYIGLIWTHRILMDSGISHLFVDHRQDRAAAFRVNSLATLFRLSSWTWPEEPRTSRWLATFEDLDQSGPVRILELLSNLWGTGPSNIPTVLQSFRMCRYVRCSLWTTNGLDIFCSHSTIWGAQARTLHLEHRTMHSFSNCNQGHWTGASAGEFIKIHIIFDPHRHRPKKMYMDVYGLWFSHHEWDVLTHVNPALNMVLNSAEHGAMTIPPIQWIGSSNPPNMVIGWFKGHVLTF